MTKIMLIDAAHAEETRVAVVDGTRVEEFDFESRAKKQLRGNIYLAKVTRVEPSLQAAFVEYGGNRHGFLAFNEIHPDYYQIPVADREALLREEAEENEAHERHANHRLNGDAEGEDAVGEDDDDVMEEEAERRRRRLLRRYKIQEVIKRRQIMLVQVVKDERGAKGASLTTYLSLAGRYCVLMPNTARGGGISRKISSAVDRKRLKGVIQSLDVPEGMGLIVRTAGAKRTKAEIKRDYEYLLRLWEDIREKTLKSIAPALIYEEEDLVKRAIRDMYDKDVDGIVVEGEEGYREAREFMRMLMPSQAKKIQPYRDAAPLFVKHRIEDNLAQIYSPVAPLRSGGYLVINQTEALVAIDVNSGKSTRERGIEATALKTNLEAAEEAARQLRLRDLAGLIVIDFIDMDEPKNNRLVEKKLKDCLKDDRARIQMGKISAFGLMELSRQRRRTGVLEGTTHVCPHCNGVGRVRSAESSALAALRAVDIEAAKRGAGAITLRVSPPVGLYILNEKRLHLARLQEQRGLFVSVQLDEAISYAEHEIERTLSVAEGEVRPMVESAVALAQLPAETYEPEPEVEEEEVEEEEEEEVIEAEAAGAEENGGRRRRRRRRGRRGDEGETFQAEARRPSAVEAEFTPSLADEEERGEEGGRGRRRRRRGRRGGRRTHEEVRTADAYGWTRARTPDGADPYGWYETAPAAAPTSVHVANDEAPRVTAAVAAEAEPEPAVVQAAAPVAAEPADIWVELPEPEAPKPARARRSRAKARPAEEAPVEAAPEAAVEPAAEAVTPPAPANEPGEPKPAPKRRRRATAAAAAPAEATADAAAAPEPVLVEAVAAEPAAPEPAPAPVQVAPPEPEPEAEPDPNEVSGKPAAPRRGWWRRGG
jgi:ribonuclease E